MISAREFDRSTKVKDHTTLLDLYIAKRLRTQFDYSNTYYETSSLSEYTCADIIILIYDVVILYLYIYTHVLFTKFVYFRRIFTPYMDNIYVHT